MLRDFNNVEMLIVDDDMGKIEDNHNDDLKIPGKIQIIRCGALKHIDISKTGRKLEVEHCSELAFVWLEEFVFKGQSRYFIHTINDSCAKKLLIRKNSITPLFIEDCNNIKTLSFFTTNYRYFKKEKEYSSRFCSNMRHSFSDIDIFRCRLLRSVKFYVSEKEKDFDISQRLAFQDVIYIIKRSLESHQGNITEKIKVGHKIFILENNNEPVRMSFLNEREFPFAFINYVWINLMIIFFVAQQPSREHVLFACGASALFLVFLTLLDYEFYCEHGSHKGRVE